MEATFCFVDIAGFGAPTETHGAGTAAALIARFMELVRNEFGDRGRLGGRAGERRVRRHTGPRRGGRVRLAALRSDDGRAGASDPACRPAHHGEAVERDGPYFGAAVNLAAHGAAEAGGGEVLATEEASKAAQDVGILRFRG